MSDFDTICKGLNAFTRESGFHTLWMWDLTIHPLGGLALSLGDRPVSDFDTICKVLSPLLAADFDTICKGLSPLLADIVHFSPLCFAVNLPILKRVS